jgi:hypothetical protein
MRQELVEKVSGRLKPAPPCLVKTLKSVVAQAVSPAFGIGKEAFQQASSTTVL